MKNFASRAFWENYDSLPKQIQELADRNFALFRSDPSHPSLHFKRVAQFRSARVGRTYRALAVEVEDGLFGSGLATILNTNASLVVESCRLVWLLNSATNTNRGHDPCYLRSAALRQRRARALKQSNEDTG